MLIAGIALVVVGVRTSQTRDDGSTPRVAHNAQAGNGLQRTAAPPDTRERAQAPNPEPPRTVATIIKATDLTADTASSQNAASRAHTETTEQRPADTKTKPTKPATHVAHADTTAPAPTSPTTNSPEPADIDTNTQAQTNTDATTANDASGGTSPKHMRQIEITGSVPHTNAAGAASHTPDADVAIVAALMSYLDTTDTSKHSASQSSSARDGDSIHASETSIRAQLRQCPAANTKQGVQCRQHVCEGHRGEVAACPVPEDTAKQAEHS